MVHEIERLMRRLAAIDHRAAVWCGCACVAETMHIFPVGEERPTRALEAARAWAQGTATVEECERAADAAVPAADACDFGGSHAPTLIALSAMHPGSAVDAALEAADGLSGDARAEELDRFFHLSMAQPWALTTPTPARLAEASEAVRAAWDRVASGPRTEHTIAELVAAHDRARRLGLDWSDPVQRAIAERTSEGHPAPALGEDRSGRGFESDGGR